jgi:hypothetical protein
MLILPCGATPLPLAGRDNGSLTLVFVPHALRNPEFPRNAGPPFSVPQRKYKNGHSEKVPARWQTTPQKITFGEMREMDVSGVLIYACSSTPPLLPCPIAAASRSAFLTVGKAYISIGMTISAADPSQWL